MLPASRRCCRASTAPSRRCSRRAATAALELDLPERKIRLAEDGRVAAIEMRVRLDSHRLIEEFMIAANVAAAKELERLRQPCMYRVHDKPDPVRLAALRSEEHTSELQSLMRISYAVFCLTKKRK